MKPRPNVPTHSDKTGQPRETWREPPSWATREGLARRAASQGISDKQMREWFDEVDAAIAGTSRKSQPGSRLGLFD
jgi:hypothetical protein